jgi:hypothetical protein
MPSRSSNTHFGRPRLTSKHQFDHATPNVFPVRSLMPSRSDEFLYKDDRKESEKMSDGRFGVSAIEHVLAIQESVMGYLSGTGRWDWARRTT